WLLMLSLCTPVQAIAKEAERGPRHPAACVPGATVRRLGPPPTHPHLQVARVSPSTGRARSRAPPFESRAGPSLRAIGSDGGARPLRRRARSGGDLVKLYERIRAAGRGAIVEGLAREAGIGRDQADQAMRQLLPELGRAIRRTGESRTGA